MRLMILIFGLCFFILPASLLASEPLADQPPADESLAETYREAAGQILGAALTDAEGWQKLTYLTTVIGHRLSGSKQLEEAISWAHETMRQEGLEVRLQPVKVPHWVRGEESAEVISPQRRSLKMLGLGFSVATPPEGITAPVVVVEDAEALERLQRSEVEGKIVVFAVPWKGYRWTGRFRRQGASLAARQGAVAALVRSATEHSLSTPHTGAQRYEDDVAQIPVASITVEDAEWFRRMRDLKQEVTVRLVMNAELLPEADSHNIIVDIPGRELPEEVVVMGGHFDSWDVGQGAHDDGAACIAAWQALRLIHQLGLQPRRTLRVVLWTNEENGLAGGKAYHHELGEDVHRHVAAIEMDSGNERPVGFGFGLSGIDPESDDPHYEAAFKTLEEIAPLLAGIEANSILRGGGGADIGPLMRDGVPGLGLRTVGEHYFDWHHSEADTLDKVDPQNFRRAIATLGVMAYVLADMPGRLVPAEASQTAAAR